jgi:hypothetical protein
MIKIKRISHWLGLCLLVLVGFIIGTGFAYGEVRLAVAPFQISTGHEKEIVRCQACGSILPGGTIEGEPQSFLTRTLWELLQQRTKGFELISPGQVEGFYNIDLAKHIATDPLTLMKKMGQQVQADYILWGVLFHFQERKGTAYGVEKPASVAFDLHLLRVKDGVMVWRTQYSKTQKSLTENLLEMEEMIKQKMRWITVEQLSRQGLEEILKDFPSAESLQ